MNTAFVDTGYLLALEIANDQHHQAAKQHWQSVVPALPRLVTTSYVFDEVVTFFNSRGHHGKAMRVGNSLLQSPSVQLIHVDASLFYEGWTYFQRHPDKDYLLTDCLSFIVKQKLGIHIAFAFHQHFAQAASRKSHRIRRAGAPAVGAVHYTYTYLRRRLACCKFLRSLPSFMSL
ncbi:MAG: PIN domain-containing protein [Gammaproteobacteria bacterium]